ncbi:MAG: acyl-CoA thioesterase [Pseudonocardiaceae bacterium]|nr:acyl-CoA thioesterase [Pseudonocardiaceae bacterium]
MGAFVAEVRPRWSDMDVFGHVNHANMVTLLEDARIELLFTAATARSVPTMAKGSVVARLVVDYHTPLKFNGSAVRVEMTVRDLKAASFAIDYSVHDGLSTSDAVVTTAETLIVPYDVAASRPRRLSAGEREFLSTWDGRGDDG